MIEKIKMASSAGGFVWPYEYTGWMSKDFELTLPRMMNDRLNWYNQILNLAMARAYLNNPNSTDTEVRMLAVADVPEYVERNLLDFRPEQLKAVSEIYDLRVRRQSGK